MRLNFILLEAIVGTIGILCYRTTYADDEAIGSAFDQCL